MLSLTCTILLVNLVNRKNVLIYLKRQDMNDRSLGPSGEINRGLPNAETLDLCR